MKDKEKRIIDKSYKNLLNDISLIIKRSRYGVASTVNSAIVMLYWTIGKRINDEVLKGDRANYGDQVVSDISKDLTLKFGKGYNKASLFRMLRFAKMYPEQEIVATVSRQLSWSHIVIISQIEEELKRDFYLEMARVEKWSVRETRSKINGMLFERTAISKKPKKVIQSELEKVRSDDETSPDLVFKDP